MRSWGGKLIVGLLIGGPIGLAIGVLIGHFLDRGVERVQSFNPFRPYRPGEREEVQEALFSAVFSIMGHLAKADGRVSEQEIGQAEAIMSRMQLNDEQRRRAQEAFRHGKDDDFPLDRTVAEFRQRIRRRRHLVVVFLELLLQTALADGELHAEEERILFRVAAGLGVPESQFRQILNMVLAQARFVSGAGGDRGRFRSGGQKGLPAADERAPPGQTGGPWRAGRDDPRVHREDRRDQQSLRYDQGSPGNALSRHREDDKYPAAVVA